MGIHQLEKTSQQRQLDQAIEQDAYMRIEKFTNIDMRRQVLEQAREVRYVVSQLARELKLEVEAVYRFELGEDPPAPDFEGPLVAAPEVVEARLEKQYVEHSPRLAADPYVLPVLHPMLREEQRDIEILRDVEHARRQAVVLEEAQPLETSESPLVVLYLAGVPLVTGEREVAPLGTGVALAARRRRGEGRTPGCRALPRGTSRTRRTRAGPRRTPARSLEDQQGAGRVKGASDGSRRLRQGRCLVRPCS